MANKILLTLVMCFTSYIIHAARVHSINLDDGPIKLLNSGANNFTDLSQDLVSPDTGSIHSFSSTSAKINPLETSITQKASAKYKARSFRQQLMLEYGDNAVVQESLYSLDKAKHLWNDLDALAYEFSDEVLYALKFDQFIEVDLYKYQNQRPIQHKNINKNIYDKARRAQKSSKKRASGYNQNVEDSILSHLFRKQTLYYLLALFLIVSVLARITKFILGLFP